jgi:hypothetical protein
MSNPRLLLVLAASVAVASAIAVTAHGASTQAASGPPATPVAALKRQVAALRKENRRLQAFTPAGIARQLASTKTALDRYQSVDAAKAAGYALASPCEFFPGGTGNASSDAGGMGVHFVSQAAMTDGKLIPAKPEILVYQPTANGGFQLVAAEYFKPDADQSVKTSDDRPSLFGRAFDGPMVGHAPGMPIHYDLHVWLWKHNPSGMFAPWNPDVTC